MACFQPVRVGIKQKVSGVRLEQEVGCGHCGGCRADQARDWTTRLMHESVLHETGWFVTLTYEELPENGSLIPQDLQRFFKSLRKAEPPRSVRYFACGEYGDRFQRPHYHAVLFGPQFLDKCPIPDSSRPHVWRAPSLEAHWPHGFSEFGTVTPASCAYVAGYVQKKISKRQDPEYYDLPFVNKETGEIPTRVPEFTRMSLRPAIGLRWLKRYWTDVYPADRVVIQGKEYKPPRYYDKVMENPNHNLPGISFPDREALMFEVRSKRIEEARSLSKYQLNAKAVAFASRDDLFNSRKR